MKTKDILTIATAALGAATLTMALSMENPLDAGGETTRVANPKLVVNNIELSLAPAGGKQFKGGDQPVFELSAINTINRPSTASFRMSMSAMSPVNSFARGGPVPAMLWQEDQTLVLGPKETKLLKITPSARLPAKSEITVLLTNEKAAAAAAMVNTPGFNPGIPSRIALSPTSVAAARFSTGATAIR